MNGVNLDFAHRAIKKGGGDINRNIKAMIGISRSTSIANGEFSG